MHEVETRYSRIVQTVDAAVCGKVLVVDDDRSFGGFMLASLESRGHDVDWAGSIQDALASLYVGRYDLLIIDLRLPDGSGLQFLRDATDEGLLEGSASIILTGHDFEAPHDIRVYRKGFELEPFLDGMADIIAATRKRRGPVGRTRQTRSSAHDQPFRMSKRPKIELVLYTSGESDKGQRALRTIQRVLTRYNTQQVALRVCDLARQPEAGDADSIVFTPTLVKHGPGSRTWIVGNLDQDELLVDLLELSGVERRRDGLDGQ
jgi:CheY-like chemotaxis protein